jgi:probable F420-dependent oxidoreductase
MAGVPLAEHDQVYAAAAEAGFTDLWSAEVAGADAFTPLALAAAWQPTLRLGTAIAPAFTRGPGLLAMTAAALAEAAPGRFALGLGASSPVLVEEWNAQPYRNPFARTRDMLRFLRAALRGERVDEQFETFAVRRFRLERPPTVPPPLLLAALRPRMLRLAGAEADGAILNWLAATDVPTVLDQLGERRTGFEVAARIFVCPTEDADYARGLGRRLLRTYLGVAAYAEFHRWLGRGGVLAATAAGEAPDDLVDELIVHGTPADCVAHVQRYADAGVDTPIIALLPTPETTRGGAPAVITLLAQLTPPTPADAVPAAESASAQPVPDESVPDGVPAPGSAGAAGADLG